MIIYWLNNLKRNNLISLGLSNDTDYLAYITDQSNTNIGKLQAIEESINIEYLLSADSILNNFIDTNLIETNLKQVYSIYLKSQFGDTLSTSDSTYLYNLAFADPVQNGDAVVSAAVILNLDVPWFFEEPRVFKNEKIETTALIRKYPNPVTDILYFSIDCSESESSNLIVKIIDLAGKLVLTENCNCNHLNNLDVRKLDKSIYTVLIYNSNLNIGTFKIIKN